MFEWIWITLGWIFQNTDTFFKPYINMGNIFYIIIIVVPIIYTLIVIQPINRIQNLLER